MRKIRLLSEGWKFVKSAADAQEAAEARGVAVTLPHTWNAEDGQDGGNDYYRGKCWYVYSLDKPGIAGDEEAWLSFDGAAMTADVYLNGDHLTHHEGGYSTFCVNLTEYLKEKNILAVAVDNSDNDHVYPQKADFTFYGGLYRAVKLIILPKVHFSLGCNYPGIRVTPVVASDYRSAVVGVEAKVPRGSGHDVTFTLNGTEKRIAAAGEDCTAKAEFVLNPVHLWDGLADPYLYTLTASLDTGDEISTRFGCRSFSMDPRKGFILNGRSYPLRGVSRHQDRKGAGNALSADMHREDMEIIREMGANTIRLAHYQHAQEFYDLCDEAGMVVWAEIPYITRHMPGGRENTLSQMRELVTQNYNHPSIVCWGLSNEITASGEVTNDLLENHRLLNDLCHELDHTRPTTMADVFMLETESPILEIPDINSYNLYFGWYLGEPEQNDAFFDEYHARYPDRVIGFSEYGADANPAYQSSRPRKGDYTETYQCVYHEHILKMIEERPWLWATHVWNAFDFAADGRDEGGRHGENQKGLVSFDRKLKKDAFYLYKAYWNHEDPFVHICGRRYADRAEDVTRVKVYSNLSRVTLYVDGQKQETKEGNHIFTFEVPLTGEHEIKAEASVTNGDKFDAADLLCSETGNTEQREADRTVKTDVVRIRKVDEPNPDYRCGTAGDVANWFDTEDLKPDCFSIRDTLGALMANPGTSPIVGTMMAQAMASRGDVARSTAGNRNLQRMMSGMSLESLLEQAGDTIKPEQITALNEALQRIKK